MSVVPAPAGDVIRETRRRLKLTQLGCATIVGTSLRSWQAWEQGKHRMPAGLWALFEQATSRLP